MPVVNGGPRVPVGTTPGSAETAHAFYIAPPAPVVLTQAEPVARVRFDPATGSFVSGEPNTTWDGERLRNPSGKASIVRADVLARTLIEAGRGFIAYDRAAFFEGVLDISDGGPPFQVGTGAAVSFARRLLSLVFPPVFSGGTFRENGATFSLRALGLGANDAVEITVASLVTFDL